MKGDTLIELGEWHLCRNDDVVYAWHRTCGELPKHEKAQPQASWLEDDRQLCCILCKTELPDELYALYLLNRGF